MTDSHFLNRLGWNGQLETVLAEICGVYDIGTFRSSKIIPVGYEDVNVIIVTDQGTFMAKLFAARRNREDCARYVSIMREVLEAGVRHPSLYESPQGYLFETIKDDVPIRACVMKYIEGKSLYELDRILPTDDIPFLAEQMARIHGVSGYYAPPYDEWSIVNFISEYEKKQHALSESDRDLNASLLERFKNISLTSLPHCFIHGDILSTNILQSSAGEYYFIDFSVSGKHPRIQEHAVILSELLFDAEHLDTFPALYDALLTEYQRHIPLTEIELQTLPVYVQAAHAMHVLNASYEKHERGNDSSENEYWLELGRCGLRYTMQQWNIPKS